MQQPKLVNLDNERAQRDPSWAPMPLSERIVNIVKVCAQRPAIAIIVTAPGLGKTRALTRAAAEVPETVTVTLNPTTGGQRPGLYQIRDSVARHDAFVGCLPRLERGPLPSAFHSMGDISRAFKRERDDAIVPVLALDEAQFATRGLLQCCRSLHDNDLCSLVLCGNDEFRTDGLSALVGRAAFEINATAPAAADVDAFLDHRRITDAKARTLLHHVAAARGIRGVDEVLRRAAPAAGGDVPAFAAIKAAAGTMRFVAGN